MISLNFTPCFGEASVMGQTGLVHMPDARIAPEGTLRIGYSYYQPYPTFWSSISLFSRLEFSARYTRIMHIKGFANDEGFGDFKDKSFDSKLILWRESSYIPQIAVGLQDFTGTRIFKANFASLNKKLGPVDLNVGFGTDRINGWYGGLRYKPAWHKPLAFVAEYDANDYAMDLRANESEANLKPGGATFAVEYTYGWLTSQAFYQRGAWGLSAYFSIPLMEKEFVPNIDEPKPYTEVIHRPTLHQWKTDSTHVEALITALETQNYKNVRVRLKGSQLELGFSQTRVSLVSRAVGRGVRTALLMAPIGTSSIKLTYYTTTDLPVVSYHFTDLGVLERFFSGKVTYGDLVKYLKVSYAEPKDANSLAKEPYLGNPKTKNGDVEVESNRDGHFISLNQENTDLSHFVLNPFNLGIFFNDPSGAFRYELYAKAAWNKQLARGLFFNTALSLGIIENVSDVTQESNSTLPHVRSDIAKYKDEKGLKIESLMLNKYLSPAPRWYSRVTAGLYEEMYGGAGGQVLYTPKESRWAFDLSVDWLKQRDYEGGLGFLDYETTTALFAVHYHVQKIGLTATARGGRFLAKDSGVRIELLRRFRSGARVGAWFTVTDGNDITPPGSPNDPYYDKGIFFYIPFNIMLTKDTQSGAGFALAPWTRDVGQMVHSPGDLYQIMQDPLLYDWPDRHLMTDFHM